MARKLLDRRILHHGDPMRVVACFHHEQANNWERAQSASHSEAASSRACTAYLHGLLETLRAEGLNATAHVCERSMVQDLVLLASAPVVLSTSSTFGFFGGFFGRAGASRGFLAVPNVREGKSPCGNRAACPAGKVPQSPTPATYCHGCDSQWMVSAEYNLLHSEVVDYHDIPTVLAALRAPPRALCTSMCPTRHAPAVFKVGSVRGAQDHRFEVTSE